MPVLLINYALNNKAKDYTPLFDAIKKNAKAWWHYLGDTWIVSSDIGADQFARRLFPHIERADRLLIVKITSEHQGWLPEEAWAWLNKVTY